jgi:hypothetical protein
MCCTDRLGSVPIMLTSKVPAFNITDVSAEQSADTS